MDFRWGRRRQIGERRRRRAFALVALFAVFLQAFVVQTHVHGPLGTALPAYEQPAYFQPGQSSAEVSAPDDHQIACALCQTLATAGSAMLPSDAAVVAADKPAGAPLIAFSLAPEAHTHSWRSRAPPSFL